MIFHYDHDGAANVRYQGGLRLRPVTRPSAQPSPEGAGRCERSQLTRLRVRNPPGRFTEILH